MELALAPAPHSRQNRWQGTQQEHTGSQEQGGWRKEVGHNDLFCRARELWDVGVLIGLVGPGPRK